MAPSSERRALPAGSLRVLLAKARYTEDHDNNVVPPLGVMYIASVLREAGHVVRIFDLGTDGSDLTRFRKAVREWQPHVLGLSAITIEASSMEAMASAGRAEAPLSVIVVGGPHATAYPERCAQDPNVDYVVAGEGEATVVHLLSTLTRGGDPASVPGLYFRGDSGDVIFTPERAAIQDVDGLPFPAWDLVDIDFYARRNSFSDSGRRRHMLVFTSRGCPFKCIYCHEVQGKKFRSRSPENVLAELRTLRERFGINDFEIIDDIFNFDRERMLDILERVRRLKPLPSLHFPNALRTDILDERQIAALRASGTRSLCVAVESTSPRLQKLVKKHLKVQRVAENIDIAVRHGMLVRGFFMLGFPTETYEEARATVDFALQSNLHQALFNIVTPFAGTELYEVYQEMLRQKGVDTVPFQHMQFKTANWNLSAMSDAELFGLQKEAYRRFYLNPNRVARMVLRHPKPLDLVWYAAPLAGLLKLDARVPTAAGASA